MDRGVERDDCFPVREAWGEILRLGEEPVVSFGFENVIMLSRVPVTLPECTVD